MANLICKVRAFCFKMSWSFTCLISRLILLIHKIKKILASFNGSLPPWFTTTWFSASQLLLRILPMNGREAQLYSHELARWNTDRILRKINWFKTWNVPHMIKAIEGKMKDVKLNALQLRFNIRSSSWDLPSNGTATQKKCPTPFLVHMSIIKDVYI